MEVDINVSKKRSFLRVWASNFIEVFFRWKKGHPLIFCTENSEFYVAPKMCLECFEWSVFSHRRLSR